MIANKTLLLVAVCFLGLVVFTIAQSLNPSSAPTSYSQNGADWTGLCHDGKSQSPIDMYEGTSKKVSINEPDSRNFTVEMHYHRIVTDACGTNNVTFVNNGNDIEVCGLWFVACGLD